MIITLLNLMKISITGKNIRNLLSYKVFKFGVLIFLLIISVLSIYFFPWFNIDSADALLVTTQRPLGTTVDYKPDIWANLYSGNSSYNYIIITEPKVNLVHSRNEAQRKVSVKPHLRLAPNQYYNNKVHKIYLDQYLVRNGQLYYRDNSNGWPAVWPSTDPYGLRNVGSGAFSCYNKNINPDGKVERHLIRGGKIWYSEFTGSWSGWSEVTSNVQNVGSGAIKCFNTYTDSDGYIKQHLIKGSQIWYRENVYGWSNWKDVTSNITNDPKTGTGEITSFSIYLDTKGFLVQHLVRGGVIYYRTNENGWKAWENVTTNIPTSLGSGPIQGFKTAYGLKEQFEFNWFFKTSNWSSDVNLLNEQDTFQRNQFPLTPWLPYDGGGYTAKYIDRRSIVLQSTTFTSSELQNSKLPQFKNWMRSKGVDNDLYPHTFVFQGK